MGERFKKIILIVASLALHLAAIGVLYYFWRPIALWYLEKSPARGIDLFLSGSFVSYLKRYFSLPFTGWKYIWYEGNPLGSDYPTLYFYLMLPLTNAFGLIRGIQIFALGASFLFAASCYLLFYELAKNRVVGFVLALAAVYSANLYRALIWAGGIPYFTTQAFFPLCLFLLVCYLNSKNFKWLCLSALLGGIGALGHPQDVVNFILPSAAFIILLRTDLKMRFFSLAKLKELAGFLLIFMAIGILEMGKYLSAILPSISGLLSSLLGIFRIRFEGEKGGVSPVPVTPADIENWSRAQFQLVFLDTNQLLWKVIPVLLALFLLSAILRKHRLRNLFSILPWGAILIYCVGNVFLLSRGINTIVTAWYKIFWPVPVALGAFLAFLWGSFQKAPKDLILAKIKAPVVKWAMVFLVNLVLAFGAYFYLPKVTQNILPRLEEIDISSSAFPERLNIAFERSEIDELKKKLTPTLFDPSSRDFRLYIIDATVNIWWNALFDLPLSRGYLDPPLGLRERGGLFWLDSVLGPGTKEGKSSLMEDWETPEEVAESNARFLLDWYAVAFLEGNHLSLSNSQLASNIISDEFIAEEETIEVRGILKRFAETTGEEEWDPTGIQALNFYKIKEELVSPILTATNATPVLVIGSDEAYDTILRDLGMLNLGPQKVIPVHGSKYIDEVSIKDLLNFEAVILYGYDYKNYDRAWRMLDKYLTKGGKVFIETGGEVKESSSVDLPTRFPKELPGLFPIKKTIREDLGVDWEVEVGESEITEGVDFSQFSPLIFDQDPWNISHPLSDEDLRPYSEVILKNKGFPVIVKTETPGKLIWSGLNLPYHVIRDYNGEEAKLLKNLWSELFNLEKTSPVEYSVDWISPEKRVIKATSAKGVLFKEEAYPGWEARVNSKKAQIYKTGPTYPGFMYIRVPEGKDTEVVFRYKGAKMQFFFFVITVLTLVFVLDYLIFSQKTITALVRKIVVKVRKPMAKWWEREEEY